jgi:CheY-like chemotaxis protein
MIRVAVTGLGMDEETRARAFDPFFTTKDVGKGTGLGLSQVYGFARQSAGHTEIESALGKGAAVKIYLPRQSREPERPKERDPADPARAGGRESVLVVEDDDAVRAYATQTLRELGYTVAEASSGEDALQMLESAPDLDLLLTDIVMPGRLNGRELADEAVKNRQRLRVLFMTGYSRDAILRQGRLEAGVYVISKPFSSDELAQRVRDRLDAAE